MLHFRSEASYFAVVPRAATLTPLAELAQDQWGLVTRRQAYQAGTAPATLTRLISDGILERIASGVFRLAGAPIADHLELRAAWLQLAPDLPAWERDAQQGVVSHRSAASLYEIGDLPADVHEFSVPTRKQTRRRDVRLHVRGLGEGNVVDLRGLPVTRPSRVASDLLRDHEEPAAVARIIVDATHHVYDYPATFADALAPHASRFGLRRGDGLALLQRMYDLVGDAESERWMNEARAHPSATRPGSAPADQRTSPR
ncbi:MAG TPA: type IV toxin-antitoxin system AbiEi family antitoxin domain-containing protein [Kineosporiaceae bacterium]